MLLKVFKLIAVVLFILFFLLYLFFNQHDLLNSDLHEVKKNPFNKNLPPESQVVANYEGGTEKDIINSSISGAQIEKFIVSQSTPEEIYSFYKNLAQQNGIKDLGVFNEKIQSCFKQDQKFLNSTISGSSYCSGHFYSTNKDYFKLSFPRTKYPAIIYYNLVFYIKGEPNISNIRLLEDLNRNPVDFSVYNSIYELEITMGY